MVADQEARDLANRALSRVQSHEVLCTERWGQQRDTMARVEHTLADIQIGISRRIGMVPAGTIAGLVGLCGWLAARAFPLGH